MTIRILIFNVVIEKKNPEKIHLTITQACSKNNNYCSTKYNFL